MQEMMTAIPYDMPLDAVSLYRRWVNWTPSLSAEEEQALFAQLEQGPDECIEARLIAGYQEFVQHIARRFRSAAAQLSYDHLDLIQEGNIGLLKAIRAYVEHRPCPFRGFAGQYIEREMLHALRQGGRVHMSATRRAEVNKLRRVVNDLTSETGETPTAVRVAQVVGKPVKDVQEMFDWLYIDFFLSLQAFSNGDGEEQEFDVPDRPLVLASAEDHCTIWQDAIEQAFQVLSEKQRLVLRLRYGLDGQRLLVKEVASLLGMHENAIESVEYCALEKLARIYPDPAALLIPPTTDYYTPSEAAAVLGLAVGSLRAWVARGQIRCFQAYVVGFFHSRASRRDVCFLKSEIDALAAGSAASAGSRAPRASAFGSGSSPYYTASETMAVLGITISQLSRWSTGGKLRRYRVKDIDPSEQPECAVYGGYCFLKTEIDVLAASRRKVEEVA